MPSLSDVEEEVHDVAVLDDVVLALGSEASGLTRACLSVVLDVVLVGDGLSPDEALLEVAVDLACGLRGGVADPDGPGPGLLAA